MSKQPADAGKSSFDLINPSAFFSNINLQPGDRVLDAACGSGRYSLEISPRLGENGSVHAVDLWEEGLANLRVTLRKRNIANIHPVCADITQEIPLENESIDFCLAATILHALSPAGQDSMLREVARVIRPGGVLAVIEFRKIEKGPGPPFGKRISEQEAAEMLRKYGFVPTFCGDIGDFNYLLTLGKIA